MKTYIVRAVKYLFWLILLFALIFVLMLVSGTTKGNPEESLRLLFGSSRGALMIAVMILVALAYPKFGYIRRRFAVDQAANRDTIIEAFARGRYYLQSERDGRMVFRTDSTVKKLRTLWEDAITVEPDPGGFTLEGNRREAVVIAYRLESLLQDH